MGKAENHVEGYLVREVEARGGLCWKYTSAARGGVPDRLVVLHGLTFFVETKAPKGTVDPRQKIIHRRMRLRGAVVYVAWTRERVDAVLEKARELGEAVSAALAGMPHELQE